MDTQRLILLFIFSFSLLMLWEAWERESKPKPAAPPPAQQGVPTPAGVPPAKPAAVPAAPAPTVPQQGGAAAAGETVRISTDLFIAEIDSVGGTLQKVELVRHKDSQDRNKNF